MSETATPPLSARLAAKFIGTFALVFIGAGSALYAASVDLGIGYLGVALAFGLTALFLYVILGSTDRRAPAGFAPLAIGVSLTVIHLVAIPITNASINPARSIGPALFAGADALGQLWLFLLAPTLGAIVAGLSYAALTAEKRG